MRQNRFPSKFSDDKDVSKCLIDLKVDGIIFDHVAEQRDEYSTTENLFIGKQKTIIFNKFPFLCKTNLSTFFTV